MTTIESVTLEAADATAAEAFYKEAFELGDTVQVRESQAPTSGFRGFTLSLVVAQPSTVDSLVRSALDAGATELKPVKKSFWGYGGVVQAPDGTIWKVATSSKKDTGPADPRGRRGRAAAGRRGRQGDQAVLRRPRPDRRQELRQQVRRVRDARLGPSSSRSTPAERRPRTPASHRRAAARTGSSSTASSGPFTDPDGFVWEGSSA